MIPISIGAVPGLELVRGDAATAVTGVTADSRSVVPGDLFVAIRGGHEHALRAVAAGAVAVLA